MFSSQMVRFKIVEISSVQCFPHKWYALKLLKPQVAHFLHICLGNGTHLKIVEPTSGPFFPCFPRKWYALKLSNPQVAQIFPPCFPRKWYALKLSNPQVHVFPT